MHLYVAVVDVLEVERTTLLQVDDVTARLESRPVPLTTRRTSPPGVLGVTLVLVTDSGAGAGAGGGGGDESPVPPQAVMAATVAMVAARRARRWFRVAEVVADIGGSKVGDDDGRGALPLARVARGRCGRRVGNRMRDALKKMPSRLADRALTGHDGAGACDAGRSGRRYCVWLADVTTTFGIGTQEPSVSPAWLIAVHGAAAMAWITDALADTSAKTA